MCRKDRHPTTCQKLHRQNETACRVDIPTKVKVLEIGGSQKRVGATDISPPVKNNTDRMNQLVGKTFLLGWRSV